MSTVNDDSIGKSTNPPLILLVDDEKNVNDVLLSIDYSKYRTQLKDDINKDYTYYNLKLEFGNWYDILINYCIDNNMALFISSMSL